MKLKLLRIASLTFALFNLFGCGQAENVPEEVVSSTEQREIELIKKFAGVGDCIKLNDECRDYLELIVDEVYLVDTTSSILSIYYVNLTLFSDHYSNDEDEWYEKYAILLENEGDTSVHFFAIHKESSALFLIGYVDEYDLFVVDPRTCSPNSFEILSKSGYGDINNKFEKGYVPGLFTELKSFSTNPANVWMVDSITGIKRDESFFAEINEYTVKEDRYLVYGEGDSSVEYGIENYAMNMRKDTNKLAHYYISQSTNHKILMDELSNYIFISLKK